MNNFEVSISLSYLVLPSLVKAWQHTQSFSHLFTPAYEMLAMGTLPVLVKTNSAGIIIFNSFEFF